MLCALGTSKPSMVLLQARNEPSTVHITQLAELGLDDKTLPALRKAQALRIERHVPRDAIVHSVVIDTYQGGGVSLLAALRSGQVLQLTCTLQAATFELVRFMRGAMRQPVIIPRRRTTGTQASCRRRSCRCRACQPLLQAHRCTCCWQTRRCCFVACQRALTTRSNPWRSRRSARCCLFPPKIPRGCSCCVAWTTGRFACSRSATTRHTRM